jgi:uncharacterized protein YuzE
MVSLEYDPSCNALYMKIKKGKVAESEPLSDNVIVDINQEGDILGIEILGLKPMDSSKFHGLKVLTR